VDHTFSPEQKSADITAGRLTILASLIGGIVLVALKFTLGIMGRSQALIADGIHSITDLASDVLAFFGLTYAFKEADENHPFGHGKIDTLMSMLIGAIMIMAGMWIIVENIQGLVLGEFVAPTYLALFGALASILIKEALFQYTYRVGRRIRNQSITANAWHHRSDAISSVAAVCGIVPALINPDLFYFDIVAAIAVAVLIIKLGSDIVIPAFTSASDISPDDERIAEIAELVNQVEGVESVHDIKARYYAEQLYVELHVVVNGDLSVRQGHSIAVAVRNKLIAGDESIMDAMVHIDPHDDPHLSQKQHDM